MECGRARSLPLKSSSECGRARALSPSCKSWVPELGARLRLDARRVVDRRCGLELRVTDGLARRGGVGHAQRRGAEPLAAR
eukprot:5463060-Prymnesium_polylepis.1